MTAQASRRRGREPSGFALPLAVLVLTLLALLAAAAVEAARAARRSSALAEADATLQGAAESALGDLAARWPASLGAMAVGDRATLPSPTPSRGVTTSVAVTRIAPDLWWVTSEVRLASGALAVDGGGGWGRRRINAILGIGPLGTGPGALVAAGSVAVAAAVDVGVDSTLVGCPPLAGDSAVLVVGPTDSVMVSSGAPPVAWRRDSSANAGALDRWGSADWAALAAAADVELPGGAVVAASGGCASGSWGSAAAGGCSATWRVVHAGGDLTVSGGSGAGVLLVDGRLHVTGAFRYSGLVVARGGVDVDGDGSAITGAVVAGASSGAAPAVRLSGAIALRASRCAVWQALARGAIPRPAPGRWWAELL